MNLENRKKLLSPESTLQNNEQNNKLFEEYRKLADQEKNVIFGGRLGNYKYYDMDKVIEAALEMVAEEL